MSRNVGIGGFEQYDLLREELLVLNARSIFNFIQIGFFLIFQGMWVLGDLINMIC